MWGEVPIPEGHPKSRKNQSKQSSQQRDPRGLRQVVGNVINPKTDNGNVVNAEKNDLQNTVDEIREMRGLGSLSDVNDVSQFDDNDYDLNTSLQRIQDHHMSTWNDLQSIRNIQPRDPKQAISTFISLHPTNIVNAHALYPDTWKAATIHPNSHIFKSRRFYKAYVVWVTRIVFVAFVAMLIWMISKISKTSKSH